MKTSIQNSAPYAIVQPSGDSSRRAGALSAWRQSHGVSSVLALIAGLFFFLFGAPAARANQIPVGCNGSGLGISLFTSSPDVHIGDTIYYSVNVFNGIPGSGRTVCDAEAIQAFIVTPDGVSHPITLLRTYLSQGQSDFYLDVVSYVVRAQDILPDGTVRATASDTGIIHQNDTDSTGGGFQGVNTEVSQPCIAIGVQCVGSVGETGLITFTGSVTNCGNNTLVNVTITNFVNGGPIQVAFVTNLLRGQVVAFSGSWIPANPCIPSTATFTARGSDDFTTLPRVVTSSASTTCQNSLTPGIRVTKVCPAQPVVAGQLLTFSGSVSNTGNVTLTNIVVVNNQPSANTLVFTAASLAPGAITNFTGSYTAPTNCSVADTLTATAASRCGVLVTSSASATCPILTTPRIAVTVLCPATPAVGGGTLIYSGTVRNTGDTTLNNIVVIRDFPVPNTTVFTVATLAPGAATNFTSSLVVPAGVCSVTTAFSGRGTDNCGPTTVTNTVAATCPIATAPAIVVTLACPATPVAPGALITYTGTVRNSGNVILNNVTIVNNQAVPSTILTGLSLSPGAFTNFTASFITPADACSVSSTVTATGSDNCTQVTVNNSASATCALVTTPLLVVTRNCPESPTSVGGVLTYSGTVSNAGNITLTNLIVTDTAPAGSAFAGTTIWVDDAIPAGAVTTSSGGDSWNFITSNPAPFSGTKSHQSNISTGEHQHYFTSVSPTFPVSTGDVLFAYVYIDPANVPSEVMLQWNDGTWNHRAYWGADLNAWGTNGTISRRFMGPLPVVGQWVRLEVPASLVGLEGHSLNGMAFSLYGGRATWDAAGKQSLVSTQVFTAITLAPGEVVQFNVSHTVPTNSGCSYTSTLTATARDKCTAALVTATATATCPVLGNANIAVTLACPVTPASLGGLLTFSGSVSNAGNVTLTNVVVLRDAPAPNTVVFSVASLAAGASANFTGSYTVPSSNLCSITTSVSASANELCAGSGVSARTSIDCPLVTAPSIRVTQTCPVTPGTPGSLLVYGGSVSNTGNITLTNIIVVSSQPVANTVVFTAATLAPGATTNFTSSFNAPLDACSATSALTATGQNQCNGTRVTNSVTTTCSLVTAPQITVTKACPITTVIEGGLLVFTGTVTNTGNITLTNIFVVNNRPVANTAVIGPITLSPGAGTNFSGSYTAPLNTCSITDTLTATGRDKCSGGTVTNVVLATCPITTIPRIAVTLACPVVASTTGGLITYTGFVTNSGNVTLTNVTVVNGQAGTVLTLATLAPHTSANFTASFTTPTDACSVSSTVTATGSDACSLVSVTNTASATCSLITTPRLVVTQNCPVTPTSIGGLLIYSGTVSNAGNITITNVVVVNNLSGVAPIFTAATLAPGAVTNFTGSYIAPTNCASTSTSTATGRSVCGIVVTGAASATCTILTAPQIVVTAACPVTPIVPGGSVTYSGTVRNAGNITLTNVVVISDRPVANTTVFTVATLAPGATTNFTGTSTVPADTCSVTTTFSGIARDICTLGSVTNTVSATCTVTTAPAIVATLACPVATATVGGLITYTGTVRNSGNVTLTNVTVVNNQAVPSTVLTLPSLAPGVTTSFTASFTAPIDACTVSSTVTASGSDKCTLVVVSNTASATCALITTPGIRVTKVCPIQPVSPGQLLTFSGSVSNTGNVTLTNIVVVNNQPAANTPVFTVASLAPGAITNFTGSYLAPTNCSVADTLIATATSRCGVAVTNSATATCAITTSPAIVVTQMCPVTPPVQGGILTYSGTVSNAGNITLTNIVVVNNWPSPNTVVFTVASLAPGATRNFTGSYIVPLNCCVAWSTVTATGQDCYGVTVTDTDTGTCNVLTLPAIVVTKVCASGPVRPGDLLTYSGTVSNSGNITLLNVTVFNNQSGSSTVLLGSSILAPGEWAYYTSSYIVPADFCGNDTVTASGTDLCFGIPVSNSVMMACPVITAPRIAITKNCPLLPTEHGALFVFSGRVSNPGNVTLVNVYVVDNQPSNNTPVIGPITLAPGAYLDYTGSYTAPLVCCELIDTVTARGQDRCTGSNVMATATAVCPTVYRPGIALVQPCPPSPLPMGSVYNFSGFVTNTGDAILTNVVVVSRPAGQPATILGPLALAPGQSEAYSGSLIVPSNTCEVTIIVTSQETCRGTWITNTTSCPIAATPAISVTETCSPGPVTSGSLVTYGGSVSNAGDLTLTNVLVFSSSSNSTPVLGPITLAPGASAPFTGSYTAFTGDNMTTNSTIVTNSSTVITTNTTVVVTTNQPSPVTFGTINTLSQTVVDRFLVGSNFNGLTYAPEDHGYAATQFYSLRKANTGTSFFDTITASTATTTDRFTATNYNFDALAYASDDVGYGPLLFYYLRHDDAGVSTFGSITPGGVVGVTADHFVVGSNFDALTYCATDVGYGANLFYYVRHDVNGLSTFGTISPGLPGVITDRFTVGNNVDALVFTDLTAPGYGANNFYYLRHDTNGVSTFGTILVTGLSSGTVTDRFPVGTNMAELTFTATDAGNFGPNLFYFLRGRGQYLNTNTVTTFTTNVVVTYTTNSVVTFTPANTVTASGMDICQADTVVDSANCSAQVNNLAVFLPFIGAPSVVGGIFNLSFPTVSGKTYTVQYKNAFNNPTWTDLETVAGTGGNLTIADPGAVGQPMRFYRIMSLP